MNVDLMPIAEGLVSIAAAAVTAAIPIVVPFLCKKLRIDANTGMSDAIAAAAQRGAGIAFHSLLTHNEKTLSNVPITNAAIAEGAAYVARSFPDYLAKLGVDPDHVEAMVTAELGLLLGQNPPPAPAPTAALLSGAWQQSPAPTSLTVTVPPSPNVATVT